MFRRGALQGSAGRAEPSRDGQLLIICGTQFLVALDYSIINVAIPSVRHDLGFSPESVAWVLSSYALAFGGLLLLGGRVADLYGRRRVFIYGLLSFCAASLLAGLAWAPEALLVSRALQGAAAGFVAPAGLGLLTAIIPEGPERQRALGIYGALLSAGFVSGMVLGGVLTEFAGWRATMLVNVPVTIAAAVLARQYLPESRSGNSGERLDVPGAIFATIAMTSLVFGLSEAQAYGWASLTTLSVFVLAVASTILFLAVERRAPSPLVPLWLFRVGAVGVANLLNILLVASYGGMLLILTLYLQEHLRFGALEAGLTFAVSGSVAVATGLFCGRLASRFGLARLLIAGIVLEAIGIVILISLPPDDGLAVVLAGTSLNAFGHILALVMTSIAATNHVPADRKATAGALLNVSQQLGLALGVGLLASFAGFVTAAYPGGDATAATLHGWRWALGGSALLALAAAAVVVAAWNLLNTDRRRILASAQDKSMSAEAQREEADFRKSMLRRQR